MATTSIGSTGVTFPDSSTQASSSGVAKAWVNFTYISSTLTIVSSYNVSSVTRSSIGQYVITFTSALADANYAVMQAVGPATTQTQPAQAHPMYSGITGLFITPTSSSFTVGVVTESNNAQIDPYNCALAVFR